MSDQVKVILDFINKKGKEKRVKFYMEKQTYKMLFDESVSEEMRYQYLIDEYHEYERERYYKRKFVSFDSEMAQALNLIEDTSLSSEEKYEIDLNNKIVQNAIKKLTPRQQEITIKVFFEDMKQVEVAKELGVSKEFVSKTLSKATANLKKLLKK